MNISNRLLPGLLAMGSACAFTTSVHAADLTNFSAINQAEFLALSKDLAATTSHKAMEPAAPLGLSGFDVCGAATMTNIHDTSAWAKVSGDSASNLLQTKLSISKGLPGGWDVGGFVSKVNSTNLSVSGIHAKYALLEGNAITPAIAVRGSYSRMGGVSGMELNNTGLDVLISKGFVGFTPYLGVGTVSSNAKATGKADESFTQSKAFAGVSWNIFLFNLSAEYDRTGKNSTLGVKAGLRF
jgi:opacity protein-like surface antigen